MQPKPIDSRHLLDIDIQNKTVTLEGVQHLRSVREHKEHPAETDYDIIHDELSGRERDESAKQLARKLLKERAERLRKEAESAEEETEESSSVSDDERGSHLDIKA